MKQKEIKKAKLISKNNENKKKLIKSNNFCESPDSKQFFNVYCDPGSNFNKNLIHNVKVEEDQSTNFIVNYSSLFNILSPRKVYASFYGTTFYSKIYFMPCGRHQNSKIQILPCF